MKTTHVLILTVLAAAAAAGPLIAQDGRPLRTMPHGVYQCALPGDAEGVAFKIVDDANFRIKPASRYSTVKGGGTYLMRGRELVFTQGPKKGERFLRVGTNQLQLLKNDGAPTPLRCTRLTATG